MADDKDTWEIDIDNKEAIKKLMATKAAIEKLGDANNLSGLIKGLTQVGIIAGTLGAAYFALKGTFDAVFEAESIRQFNAQFEILTKNAGIAGDTLKRKLEDASGGLIDDTELIKLANKSLVEMGDNAQRLPEIMTTARKVTQVFGGDLAANFEQINQAIATGQTRMLRHMGLIIDQNKAYQDYAKSIGTTVGALSQAGRQEAILNAVLDESGKRFKGVNGDLKEATNTWIQLKVTIQNVIEVITLAFEKTMGPRVREVLKNLSGWATHFKKSLQSEFGEGADAAKAKTEVLTQKLNDLGAELFDLEGKQRGFFGKIFLGDPEKKAAKIREEMASVRAELQGLMADNKKAEEESTAQDAGPIKKASRIDTSERLKQESKYNQEIAKMREKRLEDEMNHIQTLDQFEAQSASQTKALKDIELEEEKARIQEVQAEREKGTITNQQAEEMIVEIHRQSAQRQQEIDDELRRRREEALDHYVEHSQSASDGIARAFEAGSKRAQMDLNNFGKMGTMAFNSVGKHAKQAFIDMGSGAKSGSDAMKGFFFNVLADMAEQKGEFHLLAGLWPPNPVELGAGAALLALSGFLRSQAGGAGSGGGGGGGFGGGAGGGAEAGLGAERPGTAEMQQKKTLTVSIAGNYFETEQTRTRLMEMLRETQDMTDFRLVKIGAT